jgi:hypothetical protein
VVCELHFEAKWPRPEIVGQQDQASDRGALCHGKNTPSRMYRKELRELLRRDLPPRATFSDIGDGRIRKLPHGAD